MKHQRFFFTNKNGKHLIYIDYTLLETYKQFAENPTWSWETSFIFDYKEFPEIVDLFWKGAEKNITQIEREEICNKGLHLSIKKIRDIELQFIPDFMLDKNGKFSESTEIFYKEFERKIEENPENFYKYNYPYTENTESLFFRLGSMGILKNHIIEYKNNNLLILNQNQFETVN